MKILSCVFAAALAVNCSAFAFADSVSSVTKDSVGKEVTVTGKTSSFRPSNQPKAPNSFFLTDSTGQIRIVAWPDVFDQIKDRDVLKTDGTEVVVKGKAAEFKSKLELHVGNAADLKLKGPLNSTKSSSTTETQTTTGTSNGK